MTPGITIRRVHVEFLRPGPAHNQLLSPFTQYLAICNDAGAAVVGVPYEQRAFERRQKALRYETGDHRDRLDMLHEIGGELGRVLEAVPGFPGALMHDPGAPNTLVHLRLTLSAAELAQLPFELAEVPAGATAAALAIQSRPPVAVTRHIRTVSCEGMAWPDRPRVLFVSADPAAVPFEEHRAALLEAIQPFQYPGRDAGARRPDGRREQFGELLTILVDPTLAELEAESEAHAYTHVHVLTHGDRDPVAGDAYGIVFRHERGEADVVSGERFVSAIVRVGHRPAVVTVASCDSGNLGSVAVPGASFAHAIHQAGVPFVLGAQFPLSKPGSVPLAARVYRGLLWGRHPLLVLHEARADLHARYNADWHDWASLVAYEALPAELEPQLEDLQYRQARSAANAALERIDLAVAAAGDPGGGLSALQASVEAALDRMPAAGPYAIECLGVRASARKRLAQAAFAFAGGAAARGEASFADPFDLLDKARQEYARAVRALLTNDPPVLQRKATLHWVLVQLVSLQAVLELDAGTHEWAAAAFAAAHCLNHGVREERAWAHASLAELWLVRLAGPGLDAAGAADARQCAIEAARALDALYPGVDEFPIKSTRRQFERYITWWGSAAFDDGLARRQRPRRRAWRDAGGLVETAARIVAILQRPGPDGSGEPVPLPPLAPAPDPAPGRAGEPGDGSPDRVPPAPGAARPAVPVLHGSRGREAPFFTVTALPAGHGDCLWIEYGGGGRTHRLLVDCGTPQTAAALLARAESVPAGERVLELFVMTHIDADHIGGALPFFRAVQRGLRFGDVWFNGWQHVSGQLGARQGEMFSTALRDFDLPWNVWRDGRAVLLEDGEPVEHVLPGGMTLTLLSPTRVELDRLRPVWTRELRRHGLEPGARLDYSRFLRGTPTTRADVAALQDVDALADAPFTPDTAAPNGTSIALLAEYGGAAALLAADAHAPVLAAAIERVIRKRQVPRLRIDLFKVSHHGSRNNVSAELIRLLDCPRYLISTNGDHFFHPDRQAIARVLKYGGAGKTIVFNYLTELTEVWGDPALEDVRRRYGCETQYPPRDQPGVVVELL